MKKVYNFSAGPAILPHEAMEAGSKACLKTLVSHATSATGN